MTDRSPTYPGRVQLIPVTGQTNVYDMTMADSPVDPGTALNKANLLTDATAALIAALTGTTPDTPNEALAGIASGAIAFETNTYDGNGANTKTINFVHKPDLVYIYPISGGFDSYRMGSLLFYSTRVGGEYALEYYYSTGETVTYNYSFTGNALTINNYQNTAGTTYRYVGLRFGA